MLDIGPLQGLGAAIKADTLSILPFPAGLFLGMWIHQDLLFSPGLAKTTATYWMLMQISMIIEFFTAWPRQRPARAHRLEGTDATPSVRPRAQRKMPVWPSEYRPGCGKTHSPCGPAPTGIRAIRRPSAVEMAYTSAS